MWQLTKALAVVALLSVGHGHVRAEDAAARCQNVHQLSDENRVVEPGVIVPASGDVPTHCEVQGVIEDSIRFEVSMPLEGWQGRLMFLAHGGNSGAIGNTKDMLAKGFAGATTNSGHDGGPGSIEFVRDPDALRNFGFRAVHLSTVTAKEVIARFYGDEVDYAYLSGCSGGGRSALMEALRYPDDYDGIIAGAPALGWINSIAPWGIAVSRKQKENPLTPDSLALLARNSRQQCDALDGLEDGIISQPQACTLEVLKLDELLCEGQQSGCLSAGQIDTASFIYEGLKDDNGEIIYNGVYPGDEDQGDWMLWITGPQLNRSGGQPGWGYVLRDPMLWILGVLGLMPGVYEATGAGMANNLNHQDPTFNLEDFDPVRDQAELARLAAPVELPAPDFTRFIDGQGKLIIYHGWQDVPLRSRDTIGFLTDAAALSGGAEAMETFSRTYMVPNMLHCGAGTGAWAADYVTPMVAWVEDGKAPEAIVGTNPGLSNWFEVVASVGDEEAVGWYDVVMKNSAEADPATKSTRLLCPYPKVAKYTGSGEIRDASNYRCQ